MTTEKECINAATIIQASIRGFFAKRDYRMEHKTVDHCTNYRLFVKGNDPEILHLPTHLPNDKIMLVGTSGLRTLEIACKLGSDCPKILLIDNSLYVLQFWKDLQRLMKDSVNEEGIIGKVLPVHCPCPTCNASFNADSAYLASLCQTYGFDKIKRIILHASIIAQDWSDEKTFKVIGNLVNHHQYQGVYVYASNIVAYVADDNKKSAKNILSNIAHLNPTLAIHTDLARRQSPESVFYCSKNSHNVDRVFPALIASFDIKAQAKHKPSFEGDRVEILSESPLI